MSKKITHAVMPPQDGGPLARRRLKIVRRPTSASGRRSKNCCLRVDGSFKVRVRNLPAKHTPRTERAGQENHLVGQEKRRN